MKHLTRWMMAASATAIMLSPMWPAGGLAQQAAAPATTKGDVTTVAPLTVTAAAPEVGDGASFFSPETLATVAQEAREEGIDIRDASRECHGENIADAIRPPHAEDRGDFDLEALYDTEGKAQFDLNKKADAARAATLAELDARANALQDPSLAPAEAAAELTRQAAIQAYQAAQAAVTEAHRRAADLQDIAADHVGGDVFALSALEAGVYQPGCTYIGPRGATPQGEKCYAPKEDMGQFISRVNERSSIRMANGGQQTVYVPEEYRDLKLTDVVARQRTEDGATVLRVTGKIQNARTSAMAVPPLWVSALDRYGTSLSDKQMEAPWRTPHIPAGGSLAFSFELKPVPNRTTRAAVTFAPFHQTSDLLSPGVICM